MSLDLFKAIVAASPFAKEVSPNRRGEPLLYPHLLEAIEYCKEHGKMVTFFTNGSLLDRHYAERLLQSGVDALYFSIDDCNARRFSEKRKGLSFYKIIRNLRQFIALRDAKDAPTRVYVRGTLTDANRDHQQEIREFFSFADSFWFINEIGVTRGLPLYSWVQGQPLFCPDTFSNLAVRWDGQAVLCCNDWEDNFPIGHRLDADVTETDIRRVFQQVRDIGKQMMQGALPAPCVECRNRWHDEVRKQ
jgi:hypothetical protein